MRLAGRAVVFALASFLAVFESPLPTGATTVQENPEVRARHVAGSVYRIDGAVDNILVSVGDDGVLMVDTGYPFAETGVRSVLRELSGSDAPDIIIDTHLHHAFSNHLYGSAGARILAHQNADLRMRGPRLMAGVLLEPLPVAARPHETVVSDTELRFNGEDVTILSVPGGHTDSDLVVWFRGSNVVATGDLVVPHLPWISVEAGGHPDTLLARLDRLLQTLPDDVLVVPGHDPETLGKGDIREFRGMMAEATELVRARVAEGLTLREAQARGLPARIASRERVISKDMFIEHLYRSLVPARRFPDAPTTRFTGGRWYMDGRFADTTAYSVAGVLTFDEPERVDRTIDLDGGWAVPAFGEAHTHRLSDPATLDRDHADFLAAGVFYALVQDPVGEVTTAHRTRATDPLGVEVVYTQGVVTPSGGTIARMYERLAGQGAFGTDVSVADIDGRLLFRLDRPADVARRWDEIEAVNDRFVKVIVAFSDEIDTRLADPRRYGHDPPRGTAVPGVRADVLEALVERAHGAGLQVSAHIETAADYRAAVRAGVDWIAHFPASWQIGEASGYGARQLEPWLVAPGDVGRVPVITTLAPWSPDDPRLELFREVHTHNLRTLVEGGAPLLLGSDLFDGTVVDEALFLRDLGVLDDARLLELLAVQTPRHIDPGHRLGYLREGWEASFVVLGGDPTADLERIRDIRLRVKHGFLLEP